MRKIVMAVAAVAAVILVAFNFLSKSPTNSMQIHSANKCRCTANQPCWPDEDNWQKLAAQLDGKLVKPQNDLTPCLTDASSEACKSGLQKLRNPFVIESNPGDLQSQGWLDAWKNQPSIYAVEALNSKDVAKAVNFAREHNLRVAIKGTGHDYLGRSNAPNSLLIWTHKMRDIQYREAFVPTGCPDKTKPISALTYGAGTRWLEAYDAATNQHNRYVQGGGCTTVGAAGGFTQGGGFGSFSKQYGTGAASVKEIEIVTAAGETLIANQCQNPDLFWAVRGGGAGTFGVVTKMTLETHPLPATMGLVKGKITAKTDADFKKLITEFVVFYRDNLNTQHWGEQISFNNKNEMNIFVMYQGISNEEALNTFNKLKDWAAKNGDAYTVTIDALPIESNKLWNANYMHEHYPDLVTFNTAPDAKQGQYWWTPNSGEVSMYWYTYQSWWIPGKLFSENNKAVMSDAIYKASRLTNVSFHINKGLAGASEEAITRSKETSTHPGAFKATALLVMSAGTNKAFVGVKGMEPDLAAAKEKVNNVNQAIGMFRKLAPNAGTYANEADYFMDNWQSVFWGQNYNKLLSIKTKYDPDGLFYCHHCVGSEMWYEDGMCRL